VTTQPRSQCDTCVRFQSWASVTPMRDESFCEAFPAGIPDEVYGNGVDHRQAVPGDHGVQWEAKPGEEFPAYAFRPEVLSTR